MTDQNNLTSALDDVSRASSGGAPFLICYGATFIITGILSFFLERDLAALVAMFQGGVALPAAFWLERQMGSGGPMAADNPLRSLSTQLAMSQAMALPALIVMYSLNPGGIPVVLASLGGVHFFPYAWLHRTRLYIFVGAAVALGGFALQLWLGPSAFSIILLFVGAVYWAASPLLIRHARKMISQSVT
jgi:hypothetical protein